MVECIQGKQARWLDQAALAARVANYPYIWIDIGTGDGRFVREQAAALPRWFVVGVDACREQLRDSSREQLSNALFVVANALALPAELHGLAQRVSINFPWGSLLGGLLEGDVRLLTGLRAITRPDALLEVRLNAGAMAEAGLTIAEGGARLSRLLGAAGWRVGAPTAIAQAELRAIPSSWARKLAFGRDPRAFALRAVAL